jgi:hypothetical protein
LEAEAAVGAHPRLRRASRMLLSGKQKRHGSRFEDLRALRIEGFRPQSPSGDGARPDGVTAARSDELELNPFLKRSESAWLHGKPSVYRVSRVLDLSFNVPRVPPSVMRRLSVSLEAVNGERQREARSEVVALETQARSGRGSGGLRVRVLIEARYSQPGRCSRTARGFADRAGRREIRRPFADGSLGCRESRADHP